MLLKTNNTFCVDLYSDGRVDAYTIPHGALREGVWHSNDGSCDIHQVDIVAVSDTEAINKARAIMAELLNEDVHK